LPGGLGTVLSAAADALTGVVRRAGLRRAPQEPTLATDELNEPVVAGR
jgi:hypothetical protein